MNIPRICSTNKQERSERERQCIFVGASSMEKDGRYATVT